MFNHFPCTDKFHLDSCRLQCNVRNFFCLYVSGDTRRQRKGLCTLGTQFATMDPLVVSLQRFHGGGVFQIFSHSLKKVLSSSWVLSLLCAPFCLAACLVVHRILSAQKLLTIQGILQINKVHTNRTNDFCLYLGLLDFAKWQNFDQK